MENKESIFLISLVIALGLSVFFLGSTITGNMTRTMHCNGMECNDFCASDSECVKAGYVCCDVAGEGVCQQKDSCAERFSMIGDDSSLQQRYMLTMQTSITVVIALIGFLYLYTKFIVGEPKKAKKTTRKKK